MPKIGRFEGLKSWQEARELANAIYELTDHQTFTRDFQLQGQMRGAAGSVMHNMAEGFDSGSDAEFIRFLKMSRRSASEVQSELYLSLDRKYILEEELKSSYECANDTKRLINGLIAYLRKSRSNARHSNHTKVGPMTR